MAIKTPEQVALRHVPTVMRLRYGNPAELQKLTIEATDLARVAESAMEGARSVLGYVQRIRKDPTRPDATRVLDEAKHARTVLASVDERYLDAMTAANRRLDDLMRELEHAAAPSAHAGRAAIDSEIRARIAKMSDADALQAIGSDPQIRAAVVAAPRMLSGLAEDRWNRLWGEHVAAVAPEAFTKFQDLQAAMESAKAARTAIHEEAASLIDFKRADIVARAKVE